MDLKDRIKLNKPSELRLVLKDGCWKKPSSIYECWVAGPKDPDKLLEKESWDKWGHRLRKSQVLGEDVDFTEIASFVDKDPKGPKAEKDLKFNWKDLTRFNWGTDDFAEICYYMWLYLGPCLKRTYDQKNYRFRASSVTNLDSHFAGGVQYSPFIWIPAYVKPPPPAKKVGTKKTKVILDTPWCEYRSKSKCQRVKIPKGDNADCSYNIQKDTCISPGTLDSHLKGVTIGETPEEKISSIVQNIKTIEIYINRYRIHRRVKPSESRKWEGPDFSNNSNKKKETPPEFLSSSFEMITEVQVYDAHHDSKEITVIKKKLKARPRRQKSSFKQIAGHELQVPFGATELYQVAKTLRDLHAMNLLDRVTIRAYTDRYDSHIWKIREEITQIRAHWVLEAFIKEFQLPLVDETDAVADELIEKGMIPVQVLGCGAGDSEHYLKDQAYRVAIVTCETSKKKPLKGPTEHTVSRYWGFYECTMDPALFIQGQKDLIAQAKTGNSDKTLNLKMELEALVKTNKNEVNRQSLFYSFQTDQTAFDDAEANKFLDEIRHYLLLSQAILSTKKADLDEVRNEIRSWSCIKSKELANIFSENVDARLSHYFWEGISPEKGQLNEKPVGERNLWENPNKLTLPNHYRCLFESSSIGGMTDSMRKIEVMAGKEYKTTERINFK